MKLPNHPCLLSFDACVELLHGIATSKIWANNSVRSWHSYTSFKVQGFNDGTELLRCLSLSTTVGKFTVNSRGGCKTIPDKTFGPCRAPDNHHSVAYVIQGMSSLVQTGRSITPVTCFFSPIRGTTNLV